MSLTVAELIRDAFPSLPKAERRVAHEILSTYPIAGLETVARLAQRAGVSGPTILRFTTRLGFDSYPSFQDSLLSELDERNTSPLLQFEQKVHPGTDIIQRSRQVLCESLSRSLELMEQTAFTAAVDRIATTSGRVITAGGRFSELSMQMLARHLEILRPGVRHSDTIVIADHRRYQRSTIEFGRELRRRGTHLILLTDPWMSPLALDADSVLSAAVDGPSPFDSQVATVGIIETLISGVVDHIGDKARRRITDYDNLWDAQGFHYTEEKSDYEVGNK
jgi:DNA-binding MurR/RpiR family transcriptional regulator